MKKVKLSDDIIFGDGKIYIQTMASIPYKDLNQLREQIRNIKKTGIKIIRLSARNLDEIEIANSLRKEYEDENFVFVADTHFNEEISFKALELGFRKIRINPGNMKKIKLKEILKFASDNERVIRIGLNGGSISERVGDNYNVNDVINVILDFIDFFESQNFYNIVISAKFSDLYFNIKTNIELSKKIDYPLHLGVTEAGDYLSSVIKHSIFFDHLLRKGIGSTIRVSITGDPLKEIEVAREILKLIEVNKGVEIISCPTCGRTWGDLEKYVNSFRKELTKIENQHIFSKKVHVAIMGCEVNGPDEAKHADFGVSLTKTNALFFEKGKRKRIIEKKDIVKTLINELENYYF